jgi:polysaccharide chain length determinant protein (PEP-CTERM system associated)
MQSSLLQQLILLLKELNQRKALVVVTFAVISLASVFAGVYWPKSYQSSTTIHVEARNIIDPLMQGRAVRPDMSGHTENAREIINSRGLLVKVLKKGGWIADETDPSEEERLIESLRQRITTTMPGQGENLIRIHYRDDDPQRTYRTTRHIAETFIEEMLAAQEQESSAAFHFIDRQVKKYEEQLNNTQEQLSRLREENPDAQAGAAQQVSQRISSLQNTIDTLEQSLQEAQIREASLQEQLSGEARSASVTTRAEQQRQRVSELQSELDSLRLRYQETHPDIVALKQQIAEVEERAEELEEQEGGRPPGAGRDNPVYQDLQQSLYEVRTEKQTLQARLSNARQKLEDAQQRANRIEQVQATVENLTQDYEVNQDIYEDLLRRRENARVSMNLDNEQQGLSLRIQEPPYMPHQASGPRLLHFALGGLFLGGALPVGLLFGWVMVDPRIRSVEALPSSARASLIETIPRLRTRRDVRRERLQLVFSALAVLATLVAVVAVLVLSHGGSA